PAPAEDRRNCRPDTLDFLPCSAAAEPGVAGIASHPIAKYRNRVILGAAKRRTGFPAGWLPWIFHAGEEERARGAGRGLAALFRPSGALARALSRGWRRCALGLRTAGSGAVPRPAATRRQTAGQDADRHLRVFRRGHFRA